MRTMRSITRIITSGLWTVAMALLLAGAGSAAISQQAGNTAEPKLAASMPESPALIPTPAKRTPGKIAKPMVNLWAQPRFSKMEIEAGYSYWKPSDTMEIGNSFTAIPVGFQVSGTYFFMKRLGATVDYGLHPENENDGAATFQAGLTYRFPAGRFTPFVHAMGGTAHITGANVPTMGTSSFFYNKAAYGPMGMAGGGVDYELPWKRHRLAIRLADVDYQYITKDFGALKATSGGQAKVNAVRLGAGVVMRFGSQLPEPKVTYSCSTEPGLVYAGDPVQVVGTIAGEDPRHPVMYRWEITGGKPSAKNNVIHVDTARLKAGTYEVIGYAKQGDKPNQIGVCRESFIVRHYPPPTLSCSVHPDRVPIGQPATVEMDVKQNSPYRLTYSFSTTAGTLDVSGHTATLKTANERPGVVKVTCMAVDEVGQSAKDEALVILDEPAPLKTLKPERLCSITFSRDKRRPTRVDNEAKACLDQIALTMEHYTDSHLMIVGESDLCETNGERMAVQRAINEGDYLVKEKGIDPARIEYRLGHSAIQQVDNYRVPPGTNFSDDVPGTSQTEPGKIQPEPRKELPERHALANAAGHVHKHGAKPQAKEDGFAPSPSSSSRSSPRLKLH